MQTNHQILQQEMSALIRSSCSVSPNVHSQYYSFQKSLLKFFFGAVEVMIDYKSQNITLVIPTTKNEDERPMYVTNETTTLQIAYTNLETTLLDCLEVGEKQTRFYKSLLFHYNQVASSVGAWSA